MTQPFRDRHVADGKTRRYSFRKPSANGRVNTLIIATLLALGSLVVTSACTGSGGRRPIATPGERPPSTPAPQASSVQELYESGRYREAVESANSSPDPRALWFAAQSSLRLGNREQASRVFSQVATFGGPWQAIADLALALIRDNAEEIDRARDAAASFPSDPIVQFELGLAHARRNDLGSAAQAFDRSTEADPRFAYAYYNGGLAYDRLNRTDLAITRLETFARLAPDAPERPEVTSILQTVRNR